jgi:hypothetical protein
MMTVPKLWQTILLALLLAVPYFLRWKGLEPYPAVLLPEGAGQFDLSAETIQYDSIRVFGYRDGIEIAEVDPFELISPSPTDNIRSMSRHNFGLLPAEKDTLHLLGFRFEAPIPSQEEIAACRRMMRRKLDNRFDSLLLVNYSSRRSLENGELVSEKIDKETLLPLQ